MLESIILNNNFHVKGSPTEYEFSAKVTIEMKLALTEICLFDLPHLYRLLHCTIEAKFEI